MTNKQDRQLFSASTVLISWKATQRQIIIFVTIDFVTIIQKLTTCSGRKLSGCHQVTRSVRKYKIQYQKRDKLLPIILIYIQRNAFLPQFILSGNYSTLYIVYCTAPNIFH
jgi:hypothetical protein